MSRKSKRNQPAAAPARATPAAPPASPLNRRNLFLGAAAALVIAFAAAAYLYKGEKAQATQVAIAQNQPALASGHAPSFGDPAAKVHIVEFFDPACETCATFFPHVKKLLLAEPERIRLSTRHVSFHQGSEAVVRILEAARAQGKYLPTLEALYASQDQWTINHVVHADRVWNFLGNARLDLDRLRADMNSPEIAQRMRQDMADAKALGVTKTPEFFVNGRPLPSFGLEELQALVKGELKRAYP